MKQGIGIEICKEKLKKKLINRLKLRKGLEN